MKTSGKRSSRTRSAQEEVEVAARTLFGISRTSYARIIVQVGENERTMEWKEIIVPVSSLEAEQNKPTTEDDSDETLNFRLKWNDSMPRIPPERIVSMVGKRYTKPIRKQLTMSDVKKDQNRLMLGQMQVTKNFLTLLTEPEIAYMERGIRVYVYGPNGEVHDMMFKMWNKKTPVLMSGWNKFVEKYDLQMHRSFLTIWMFRNFVGRRRKIYFAIDCTNIL